MPQAPIIMIIRHCEKPDGSHKGVRRSGSESEHSLSVRGWQRAGALIHFFAPGDGGITTKMVERPAFLFAACPDAEGADARNHSRREEETLIGLSELLVTDLNLTFGKGQEAEIAAVALNCAGPVLIAWEHRKIIELAAAIAPDQNIPVLWPSDRFDLVFVFHLNADGKYAFSQVPQRLLSGDTDQLIT